MSGQSTAKATWIVDAGSGRAALLNPSLSRSPARSWTTSQLREHVLNLDGAEHRRLRAIVRSALDRNGARVLAGAAFAGPQLADAMADGRAATQVPGVVAVLLDRLLGLTAATGVRLEEWVALAEAVDGDRALPTERVATALDGALRRRPEQPRTGVIGALAESPAPREQQVATALFLWVAGYLNTTRFLTAAMARLTSRPDPLVAIAADPSSAARWADDLLAQTVPAEHALLRVAVADTDLGGRPVHAGTVIRVQRDATTVFGAGSHHCPAAGLVRSLTEVLLVSMATSLHGSGPGSTDSQGGNR